VLVVIGILISLYKSPSLLVYCQSLLVAVIIVHAVIFGSGHRYLSCYQSLLVVAIISLNVSLYQWLSLLILLLVSGRHYWSCCQWPSVFVLPVFINGRNYWSCYLSILLVLIVGFIVSLYQSSSLSVLLPVFICGFHYCSCY
jgi:hypothetical protein